MAELTNRIELSEQLARKLQKLNKAHAAEFRKMLGNPPDPKRIKSSFWDRVEKQQKDELAAVLLITFIASYDAHRTWGSVKPPETLDLRNETAEAWVESRASRAVREITTHSVDILDAAGNAWDIKIKDGKPIERDEIDAVVDRIFGPGRAERVGFTEVSEAMVRGGRSGIKHAGVEVTVYWGHSSYRPKGHSGAAVKPCPLCTPMEGLPESMWGGKSIPLHPRCDCFEIFVDDEGYVVGTARPGVRPGNNPNMTWKYRKP